MANTPLYIPALINRGKWNDYRDEIWGDSYSWAWTRSWDQIEYLVIHHSVTAQTATPDDIAAIHMAQGWGGVGYHFIITADGIVHYVGDISTARANVANKNEKVIGICLVGDFTKHLPTDEQIKSAHDLCKFFIDDVSAIQKFASWDVLKGHKDLTATACPGSSWPNDMRQRIIDRRIYSPVISPVPEQAPAPEPVITPEPTLNWEEQVQQLKKQVAQLENEKLQLEEMVRKLENELSDCRENSTVLRDQLNAAHAKLEQIRTILG